MSKPINKTEQPAEERADDMELKDLPPEGEQFGGGQRLPSTISGGGGQGAVEVNDKPES